MGAKRSKMIEPEIEIEEIEEVNYEDKSTETDSSSGTISDSTGKNSPIGEMGGTQQGSSGSGRTMKELEDQVGSYRTENFNLKLRIYLLEKHMNLSQADLEALRKDLDLETENEGLKQELKVKQDLLAQAAGAIKRQEDEIVSLTEEKKKAFENENHYQQLLLISEQQLHEEREKVHQLTTEIEELKLKMVDSAYYEGNFTQTDKIIEYIDKIHQLEEINCSLEAELKQRASSLEEERNWAAELETERDNLKRNLEEEINWKKTYIAKRDQEFDELRKKVKELEEQLFMKDNSLQQIKKDVIEKEKIIDENCLLLEEKTKAYEEITAIAEKRKKQVDQLRLSLKARDDVLTDLNNKNRSLLVQVENSKRSASPRSPSVLSTDEYPSLKKTFTISSPTKSYNGSLDLEPCIERTTILSIHEQAEVNNCEKKDQDLRKELLQRDMEIKDKEDMLYQLQSQLKTKEQKLNKLNSDYRKALKTIQGFLLRHEHSEIKEANNARRIMNLELEISRLRNELSKSNRITSSPSVRRNLTTEMLESPERDQSDQQRLEEMESNINDLQDQIDSIKAEKMLLEKQTHIQSEELCEKLQDRELKIEYLECEKNSIRNELQEKEEELNKLKQDYDELLAKFDVKENFETSKLKKELLTKNNEVDKKNQIIEGLSRELQIKTQNLQKLVNTELWSKNKEIAKLHNHTSQYQNASTQLSALVKELNEFGIQVTFMNDIIQLNYINGNSAVDLITITDYIQKLIIQRNNLEKEINYLKWMKNESTSNEFSNTENSEKNKRYCELLRTHLKDLMRFMKEILRNANQDLEFNPENKMILDVFANSKILPDDFINALEIITLNKLEGMNSYDKDEQEEKVIENASDNIMQRQISTPSDSETFSEPDRMVSFARMGLQDTNFPRGKSCKDFKSLSDSEDSMDYQMNFKMYPSDLNDFDANRQLVELKDINNFLYTELTILRKEIMNQSSFNSNIDQKLAQLINKIEKSQRHCEKLQITLEKKIYECCALKKESKQNNIRKSQLEKRIADVENMAVEVNKQKTELLQYMENIDKQSTEMVASLKKENEMLRIKIKKLEEENDGIKNTILRLTKELDQLTLKHSQTLVENTKLVNEKLRLEQELRRSEDRYDVSLKGLQNKFHKEVNDLNQINESHRARMQELEASNKELRRHVVICEASESAPSSSGISSLPPDVHFKISTDENPDYRNYHISPWLPITYSTSSGRSKSSCSPDLGIESDTAMSSLRPLKDTLKITESMTNLLSDDDNNNPGSHEIGNSPLSTEGLDEVEILKQENEALKRRLMKTRKALEDTFQHLSASNKNKKNVEKAITKQLLITKSILNKTRNFDELHYDN